METETLLYEQTEDGQSVCLTCARECRISEGSTGWCRTRTVRNGKPYSLIYGEVSSCSINPIEKKPVYHFFPGSRWLSVGSVGCNFRCPGCQNWEIAHWKGGSLHTTYVPPDDLVAQALSMGCQGVSWTFNEPALWLEYTLDGAILAKDAGLYTNYVTNGYLSWQALEKLAPYLDVFRVDIKGFSQKAYKKLARIDDWETVLANTVLAAELGMHVEVITNIIPGVNDDLSELGELASWIEDTLGAKTPWHVTKFFPHLYLNEHPPTEQGYLETVRQLGKDQGLWYVYLGNIPGHDGENTSCHVCGDFLVKRYGMDVLECRIKDNRCPTCNTLIPGVFE